MEEGKVKDLCESLAMSKEWPRDKEEIEKLWKRQASQLKEDEQVYLLKCLVQNDYVFKWLRLISYLLPDLASDKPIFIELLEEIIERVKADMAQGEFIRSLINIGEKHPQKGIALYSRLIETSSDTAISYSGLILGGAAKRSFEKVFRRIKEDFYAGKPAVKAACLKAIRVTFEDAEILQSSEEIFEILESVSKIKDSDIRREVVHGYIDFDRFAPAICEEKLLRIAKEGDSNTRYTIVNRLWLNNLQNQSTEIAILQICSGDDDIGVLEGVARVLSRKGQAFLNESLDMIRGWLERPESLHIPSLEYYLQELGKNRLGTCIETIEHWIDSNPDRLFHLKVSRTLRSLCSSNFDELLTAFEGWIAEKGIDFKRIVVETITDILLLDNPSHDIIDRSFSILKQLTDESTIPILESNLLTLFGSRPPFTEAEKIIEIVTSLATDHDWRIRKASISALRVLSEYKIDSEETLHMLVHKTTKETRVTGISSKKIETPEGIRAYELLVKLTRDRNHEVSSLAKGVLVAVDSRLREKEARIDKQVSNTKTTS